VSRRNAKAIAPAPGGESFEATDLGEPVYPKPVPEARGVVPFVPGDPLEVDDLGEPVAAVPKDQAPVADPGGTKGPSS
jgi:hypothetical protein